MSAAIERFLAWFTGMQLGDAAMTEKRCKVGDLCIVTNDTDEPINNGRFVMIVSAVTNPHEWSGPIEWECEAQTAVYLGGAWIDRDFGYLDCELTPIRDPGDDAVDEIVRSIGAAPMTLTEVRELGFVS